MAAPEQYKKNASSGSLLGSITIGNFSLEHIYLLLMHRKWIVIAIFLVLASANAYRTSKVPRSYTAETVLMINPPEVSNRFAPPTVATDLTSQFNMITMQIFSSDRLQQVIEKMNLYPNARKTMTREQVIDLMRKDTAVTMNERARTFSISYTGTNPKLVADVVNEIAKEFIEENLAAQKRVVSGTTGYLQEQLAESRKEMEAEEAKVTEFKLQHNGELPNQQASAQVLAGLRARAQDIADAISRAEQQRLELQQTLAEQEKAAREAERAAKEAAAAGTPVKTVLPTTPEEAQLAALQLRYGDQHPDVQNLKRLVEEQRKAREQADRLAAAQAALNPAVVPVPRPVNPTVALQAQLKQIEKDIAQKTEDQNRINAQIALYEQKVQEAPMLEVQLADLMRNYDLAKSRYNGLLSAKLSADSSIDLEMREMKNQFTILEPARVPEIPSGSGRRILYLGGTFLSGLIAVGAGLSTELFGLTVTSAAQLADAAAVPVLGIIPYLSTKSARRRRRAAAIAGVAAVLLFILAGALLYFFHAGERIL